MDPTDAGQTRVTFNGGRHPVWSPDGTTLAFSAVICRGFGCYPSIFTKTGSQVAAPQVGERPSWSPDGRRIVVDFFRCDFYYYSCDRDIYIMTVDGTDLIRLADGHSTVWRAR
jgi:Tol biopolymer transport system component